MKFIISGGGTGGHIFPAIAIADALRRRHPEAAFLFVGADGRMEMEKVPKAGYEIEGLWISGFQRSLSLQNLLFPFKVLSSLWKARGILRRFKPDAVVGVGGFASGPTLKAAGWLGIPTVIHEQNSYAGATNRMLAKKVHKICVAYEGMEQFFPSEKIVMTGNPVRQDILSLEGKRVEAFKHYGLDPNKKTLFVVGGSLGARTLNESVAGQAALLQQQDIQVFWQTGKLYYDEFAPLTKQYPNLHATAFVDRMDLAYALSDVVVSRAGALAIAELALVRKPIILVPSPNVAADHQTANAMALVKKDAALLVKDAEARTVLIPKAIELLGDMPLRQKLIECITPLGISDAGERIAQVVLDVMGAK